MSLPSAGRVFLILILLCGCSIENKKVDYKSEAKQVRPLEVPPDLAAPSASDRYTVPDANAATYSDFHQGQPARTVAGQTLLPQSGKAHVERAGTQRWLFVEEPPEQVWPVVKEFWQEMGFIIVSENAETGIMETDWAENRAKIPQDALRNLLGKVIDQAYSTPERDKFRSRLERGQVAGTTEVFVTHRGMYEMFVNDANMRQAGKTVWQPRPADPELEAEMLQRLQAKFSGAKPVEAVQQAKPTPPPEPRAVVSKGVGGAPVLVMKDDFDRAWRRVGLSLDRLGFTVQDRDRAGGLYYVRYLNPDADTKKSGLLSKLAFWESDGSKAKPAEYRIVVADAKSGSEVKVLSADGAPEKSEAATHILTVLQEDLK
ncbi:MAG TPA: outer membrane protein assembly factor BamC [Burkholderiales bacterium]|nr:outer membrane protein assembly factor BamC [Burkholderiales bacterium]